MKSVLVTGANRGIGLGLVKDLATKSSPKIDYVFATYRDEKRSEELLGLAKQHQNLIPVKLDPNHEESITAVVKFVEQKLNGQGLNLLFNNAGSEHYVSLDDIDEQKMLDTYKNNVITPWKVTKAFLPLVEKSVRSNKPNPQEAAIINMSTIMASVELAPSLPMKHYDYQCSKVALNMFTRLMADDLKAKNIFITLLHPGWVKTEMGGENAQLTLDEAIQNIVQCLKALKPEHQAQLIDSTTAGKITVIPW